jgi:hypothetical protein
VRQLALRQLPEEVSLILARVAPAQQTITIRLSIKHDARVVARRHLLAAEALRQTVERGELQAAVAGHARDRRLAFEVGVDERLDHVALELAFEVQDVEREAQVPGHAPRVVHVVERAAARRQGLAVLVHAQPPPLIPKLHREADQLVPRVLQHRRRRRTIDAAAHGYRNLHYSKR